MFHFTCSSAKTLPSGLQDWDNASISQTHWWCAPWQSGVGGPVVINAMSILPSTWLCQQPYSDTRQLNLCKTFPPLKHAGRGKPFIPKAFWTHSKCRCCLYVMLQGKYLFLKIFLNLLLRRKKKPGQSSSLLSAKFFKLCNLNHRTM